MTCGCPTTVAHPDGCERKAKEGDTLCDFCDRGHNEPPPRWRVSMDTPVAMVVPAVDRRTARELVGDKWKRVWDRLDEVAVELQKELGVEVVVGFPYDDVETTKEMME